MTLDEAYTCEMYLIIRRTKYFVCLIFVVGSGRRKIFNGENFPIYGTCYNHILVTTVNQEIFMSTKFLICNSRVRIFSDTSGRSENFMKTTYY